MANVMITGGAGYIGSHTALAVLAAGHEVTILDNLSTGFPFLAPPPARLVLADVGDESAVRGTLEKHAIDTVIHFAGSIVVPESLADPLKYYENNLSRAVRLLNACVAEGIDKFIFSSTAAVYGEPSSSPVSEATPASPINPYGWSKLMCEQVLADTARAHPLRYVALRYFNVAGADPELRAGQAQDHGSHLIKAVSECVTGKRDGIEIFGSDYPTPDGTCVRDYIHVSDLAEAHVKACDYLAAGGESEIFNCGYGRGYSVREVVETTIRNHGNLTYTLGPRRAGDPASLVSDVGRIRRTLDWAPRHDSLDHIIETAIAWERKLPSLKSA